MVNRGRLCAPSAIFTNSLHFLHYPTLSPSIIQTYFFITITLYLLLTLVMIKTRFSRWLTFFTFAAAVALALPAKANTWPLPSADSRLVGENKFHVVENDGGSLEAIAKKYNVGFLALLQANPGVDPYVPRAGSVLTIPLQTLLPDAPREGIVINIAELRLYYYPPGKIR